MKCPWKCYVNKELHTLDVLEAHIMDYGFYPIYTTWIWHGEDEVYLTSLVQPSSSSQPRDEMVDVLMDLVNESVANKGDEDVGSKPIDEGTPKYEK